MKIYHNIFDELVSFENLYKAWRNFRLGKTNKESVIIFGHNLEDNLFRLKTELEGKTYRHGNYKRFIVCDPKQRIIHKAEVRDRVIHTLTARKLEEIYQKTFISHSFACQKERGTHRALKSLEKMCRRQSRNYTRNFYYLKCDIKKFFDNVDHNILLDILRRTIKDKKFIWLIGEILKSFHKDNIGAGLPLGNFTSQWFGNIYLHELDCFVKHKLKAKHYVRYADDFVILGEDKKSLLKMLAEMQKFLADKLKLNFHPDKIAIKKFNSGIEWMGYKILPHYVIIKKQNKRRLLWKITGRKAELEKDAIGAGAYYQTVNSYLGQLSHCCGRNIVNQIIYQ
jgi:retron-type reverse transcriptase